MSDHNEPFRLMHQVLKLKAEIDDRRLQLRAAELALEKAVCATIGCLVPNDPDADEIQAICDEHLITLHPSVSRPVLTIKKPPTLPIVW